MVVEVEKEDIGKIGYSAYDKEGNTVIICESNTCGTEEILLRNILKCFGDEYRIVKSGDSYWENNEGKEIIGFEFETNLPYEIYMEICNYHE